MILVRTVGRWLRNGLLVGLGGLGAVLLFHLFIMPLFVRHGQETGVPDIRGLPVREVTGLVAGASLAMGRVTKAVDEHIPAGRIVRQNPPPGSSVKKGRELDLVVSLGPATLRVPELEGESLLHARFLLAREGIMVGKIRTVACRAVPREHIVAVSPPPGTRLAGKVTVDLLVSAGGSGQRYLMPDLRGMEAGGAKEMLEAAGLQVHRRMWPGSRGLTNQIVEQTPPPGYPIEKGGTVEIVTGG